MPELQFEAAGSPIDGPVRVTISGTQRHHRGGTRRAEVERRADGQAIGLLQPTLHLGIPEIAGEGHGAATHGALEPRGLQEDLGVALPKGRALQIARTRGGVPPAYGPCGRARREDGALERHILLEVTSHGGVTDHCKKLSGRPSVMKTRVREPQLGQM
jgi:hypothetical protein